MKTAFCMVVLTILAACSNAPSRHYSLAPLGQQTQPAASDHAIPDFAIRLTEVRVPGSVDRPQLVVRQNSGTAVAVLNQSLWAAPLTDQIRAALAQELMQVLAVPDVSFMAAPAHLPVWTVAVQIRRFELVAGARTVLDASWTFGRSAPDAALQSGSQLEAPTQICRTVIHRPVSAAGVEPLVDSQRTAVTSLAHAIAQSISAHQATSGAPVEIDKGCTFS